MNHFKFLTADEMKTTIAQQEADGNTLSGVVVKMAEEVAKKLAEMFGVEAEAIPPFLVECNSMMLVLSGEMINQAKVKLSEASLIELAVKSL